MKRFIAITFFAILAAASPVASTPPKGISDADKACGDQVVSCCNPTNKESSSGLISAIVGPILANGCVGVSANALNILSPIIDTAGMCGSNTIQCCSGNKNSGLIVVDLQCTSL
ncbi:hypothetical protein BU24DRAFT_410952 [Aaosphaeria arxii CBS 175.79]|uniref:Hydrophobin n=1 Tax=Aaosphaeria arxii CBS 175.79 TaxID=1450172 RepID=A0A6A5XJX7_9PLEO|nr:uncharacterized protein BU24DRAFT_410952 [Aaosphaeria arxii CBS 175.79]KAF2013179.1 hypothetical protein BU24DRAFT_410952 [Aaosphaeria arxii CBS 175.79]